MHIRTRTRTRMFANARMRVGATSNAHDQAPAHMHALLPMFTPMPLHLQRGPAAVGDVRQDEGWPAHQDRSCEQKGPNT
eukprot:12750835-Alexandrium_andersonii.AAC.1